MIRMFKNSKQNLLLELNQKDIKIIIIDISPDYKPSNAMLMGEPYLIEYQKEIRNSLSKLGFKEDYLIKNHVHIWIKKI